MTDEHRPTGLGWPGEEPRRDGAGRPDTPVSGAPVPRPDEPAGPDRDTGDARERRDDRETRDDQEIQADRGIGSDSDTAAEETAGDGGYAAAPARDRETGSGDADAGGAAAIFRRPSAAGVTIGVLLALLGFAIAVQFRTVSADPTLASARQEDLVRILSDLEAREQRLRTDISQLEESQRQLRSGALGRQAALEEASRRADELGILAGILPARGPGLVVRFRGPPKALEARAILDAVEELRGAGAEAMQISGGDDVGVRIIASTYFLDAEGGINVDGKLVPGPYTLRVIGDPETMRTALHIPGGVAESVAKDGGTVTDEPAGVVEVSALHEPTTPQYARPVS